MSTDTITLIELLNNFVPEGEQEIADRKLFLKRAEDSINLTRNSDAHFTASAFVLNQDHTKVLAIFHNIYQSWGWMGGHADGDADLLNVAKKEVSEESGILNLKLLKPSPISIESIPVAAHIRRGESVAAHIHLNVTFLFEASDTDEIHAQPEENSGVKWTPVNEFIAESLEPHMKLIYQKIINRLESVKADEII